MDYEKLVKSKLGYNPAREGIKANALAKKRKVRYLAELQSLKKLAEKGIFSLENSKIWHFFAVKAT